MTISSNTIKAGPYSCSGTTGPYAFAFKCFDTTQPKVVRTSAAGVESTLVLTSGYTVALNADQDNNPGGTVTTVASYADGKITIVSNADYLQQTDITNAGGFYPQTVEDMVDKIVLEVQQVKEATDRAVKVDVSSTTDPAVLIASLLAAATAAAASASAASTSATAAATSATASATSATASAGSATAAATSATNASNSATAAAGSATTASTQATNAGNSATAAAGSATTASTQATNAAGSATTATTQAGNASASATAAAGSATTASTQAGNASTSATAAAGSATAAATSATNAAASATAAATSAASFINGVNTFTAAQRGQINVLSDAATVAVDFSLANNYRVVLGGNRTLGVPTNVGEGQSGIIRIVQDNTGSRTLAYSWPWQFAGGTAPVLSTTAWAKDDLSYSVDRYLSGTFTVTIASPGVITYNAHGLNGNQPVQFTTTGALPTGIVAGTTYYVVGSSIATNTFQVSATAGGAAINTSGSQSGVHTLTAMSITASLLKDIR